MVSTPGNSDLTVADFYSDKSVFITGGTGFLGKVIVEKLLFSCPKVKKIYLLVREKNNCNIEQRLQQFFDSPVFNRLRKIRPHDVSKVIPVMGDISEEKLGISANDENILIQEISVVIHAAATVRFNESLKTAFQINLEGTRKVLNLCKRMRNLQILVHVSTAYSNTQSDVIEEKFYPTPVSIEEARQYINEHGCDEEKMNNYLFGRPNTYTFTKSLAEKAVEDIQGDIPAIIVRPSIVTASKAEPIEGWVDNWNGATGNLYVIGKGLSRALYAERHYLIDLIPVDYVSNFILVAGAKCHGSRKVKVLNCCSSSINPVTIGTLTDAFIEQFVQIRFNDVPYPSCFLSKRKWLTDIIIFFLEILPAFFADIYLYLCGKETKYEKIRTRIAKIRNTIRYFSSHSWVIENKGALEIISSLTPEEAEEFPCDPRNIGWKDYLITYIRGVKKFLVDGK